MQDFIKVSDKATQRINDLLSEEKLNKSTHFLRVGVKGGGCSGLSYVLDFDDTLNEGDSVSEDNGVRVVVDKKSLLYLFGTELNFSDGLNGKGFEFVNPNASRTCGCGESFSI
jgi:iron-sulfur cluster assembly protein